MEKKFDEQEKQKIIEDLHKTYRSRPMPNCPNCKTNENVIPIINCFYISPELDLYRKAGFAVLAGCSSGPSVPKAKCKKCDADIFGADDQ